MRKNILEQKHLKSMAQIHSINLKEKGSLKILETTSKIVENNRLEQSQLKFKN